MSSTVTVKQETMPNTVSPPSSNDKNSVHTTVLTIDAYTDPNVIKAIPFEDTWATYAYVTIIYFTRRIQRIPRT